MRYVPSGFALLVLAVACSTNANAGVIYASNFGNNTITKYDSGTGAFLSTAVTAGAEANGFNGVVIGPGGEFFVAGQYSNNVVKYGPAGTYLQTLDPGNSGGLDSPQAVTFGPDGNLYVASAANDKILRYDPSSGSYLGVFSDLGANGHVGPIGLAFGPDGNLYVSGFDNGSVFKVNGQTGAIIGSTAGPAGFGFGPIEFGPDGALYLAAIDLSTFGGRIYRFDPVSSNLEIFIAEGTGGLTSPGGFGFSADGFLVVTNLLVDQNFADIGSTLLRFDSSTGAPVDTLVGAGQGLNIPFFVTTSAVPEPSPVFSTALGMCVLMLAWHRGWLR
ncbi:MAG: NHL repeat-containing protein [Bryobacterales bacterium]|nr:NHL repeat-containing protein [Bryobacterales bacterium]